MMCIQQLWSLVSKGAMNRCFYSRFTLCCWLLVCTFTATAATDVNAQVVGTVTTAQSARLLVNEVYRPFHNQFADATKQWLQAAESACSTGAPADVLKLQVLFTDLVAHFAKIELFRVGPLLEDNLKNRLFYWPDKRRVSERQLRALLADPAVRELRVEQLAQKSVALQGLPVLERLLFTSTGAVPAAWSMGKPATETGVVQEDASPSLTNCHVMLVIVQNIDAMARQLRSGWQDDSAIVQSLLNPTADSGFFRNGDEVLRSVVTQIVVGLDVILNRKIMPMLAADPPSIRKAPMWRSKQTLTMLEGNLVSIRALLLDSGLALRTDLDNELRFEFRTAFGMLAKLQTLPVLTDDNNQLSDDAYLLFRGLSAVVRGIAYTAGDRFSATLGISAGFNSEDGD